MIDRGDPKPLAAGATTYIDVDLGNESGVITKGAELESITPGDVSQHTFGLKQVRSSDAFDFMAKLDCGHADILHPCVFASPNSWPILLKPQIDAGCRLGRVQEEDWL